MYPCRGKKKRRQGNYSNGPNKIYRFQRVRFKSRHHLRPKMNKIFFPGSLLTFFLQKEIKNRILFKSQGKNALKNNFSELVLKFIQSDNIDCQIINFTRPEGGRRIVILRRPITQ